MSDDVREKVAQAIWEASKPCDEFGQKWEWVDARDDNLVAESVYPMADAAIAGHLAGLGEGGYAIVRLPEPDEREDEQEFTDFPGVGLYVPVVFDRHPGEVQIRAGAWCDEPLSVDEARELAASILAAAAAAGVDR